MASTYPGMMIAWVLRHPQSPQEQEQILANGDMMEIRSDSPQVFRLASAQTGHMRQLEIGFRKVNDPHNVLSTVKAAMVTIRMKRRRLV